MFENVRVLIKGAGDLATGVAARLWRSGFPVMMTELAQPLTIRRTVALSEAVYDGETTVEDLTACRVSTLFEVEAAWRAGKIPVWVEVREACLAAVQPEVLVDATLAKRDTSTRVTDAPFVVGLGSGFSVGQEAHAVVETNRGHYLGRVLWSGSAQPDTGAPGDIAGFGRERVIYAPADGVFEPRLKIGDRVNAGDVVGVMGAASALAPIAGILRGLIHAGVPVQAGLKIGDVDPRAVPDHCWTISDKALAIGGGVLEAILIYLRSKR